MFRHRDPCAPEFSLRRTPVWHDEISMFDRAEFLAALAGAVGGAIVIASLDEFSAGTAFPLVAIPIATSIVTVLGSPKAEPAQPRALIGGHLVASLMPAFANIFSTGSLIVPIERIVSLCSGPVRACRSPQSLRRRSDCSSKRLDSRPGRNYKSRGPSTTLADF